MFDKSNWLRTSTFPSKELSTFEVGYEDVKPREPYQYEELDYYLIHLILKGKGIFMINDQTYQLGTGDIFFIPPHTKNNYFPLASDPWSYRWIGVKGTQAAQLFSQAGLGNHNYVYHPQNSKLLNHQFTKCYDYFYKQQWLGAIGAFYEIINQLSIELQTKSYKKMAITEHYVTDTVDIIKTNYHKPDLTIEDIAIKLQIDRTYLSKLFTKYIAISPKQYLIQYRLSNATSLLIHTDLSITEIGMRVGFSNYSTFSKTFSKYRHLSPSQYRKEFTNGHFSPREKWL